MNSVADSIHGDWKLGFIFKLFLTQSSIPLNSEALNTAELGFDCFYERKDALLWYAAHCPLFGAAPTIISQKHCNL